MFPHHENEIAQSRAYFGCQQWANYWMHTGIVFKYCFDTTVVPHHILSLGQELIKSLLKICCHIFVIKHEA